MRKRGILASLLLICMLLALPLTAAAQETEQRYVLTFAGDCTLGTMPSSYSVSYTHLTLPTKA